MNASETEFVSTENVNVIKASLENSASQEMFLMDFASMERTTANATTAGQDLLVTRKNAKMTAWEEDYATTLNASA